MTVTMTPKRVKPPRTLARWMGAGMLALAAGLTLPVAAQPGPGMGRPGMDGPHGGPGMGGPDMMMMGDPAHMGRGVDRMLDGLGVSDAQRSQIQQIVQAASTEMRAQHEAGRALRDKGLQLLTAPTIDATAAEALRQQMQVQHDQASKRMLQTLIDVARVLTPEQRAKLGERMKLRRDAMQERMQRGAPRVTEQKG